MINEFRCRECSHTWETAELNALTCPACGLPPSFLKSYSTKKSEKLIFFGKSMNQITCSKCRTSWTQNEGPPLPCPECHEKQETPFEFKVGDIVSFGGMIGKIITTKDSGDYLPIQVLYNNGHVEYFTLGGKYHPDHTEPLLKFILRPKKKAKKSVVRWVSICKSGPGYNLYNSKVDAQHALDKYVEFPITVPITVPVTIEWEEDEE